MAMSYTSLVAPKGTTGSIANWVNYTKLDLPVVLDEAQMLIYEVLRVREMRTEWTFGMTEGQASVALPSRFLDPIGEMIDAVNGARYTHLIETPVLERRYYEERSGTLGTDPFTTVLNSALVTIEMTGHDLTQDSTVTFANAPTLNGLVLTGAFPVTSITDADHYVIDLSASDDVASASGSGGGAGVTFVAQRLNDGSPSCWGIWDERIKFDSAFDAPATIKQLYYRQPRLLSATNLENFLTRRYPKLMRVATSAAAADFMKDDAEYQKHNTALLNLINDIASKDDMTYRGASFGTDTPYGR